MNATRLTVAAWGCVVCANVQGIAGNGWAAFVFGAMAAISLALDVWISSAIAGVREVPHG